MRRLVCFLLYIALFGGSTHAAASISPQSVSDSIAASATIKEVIIEGKRVIQYPDKDVWIITKEMRKNAFNTKAMLGNIPGMYYNYHSGELSYNGQKNIKILMDGKEKPEGYIEDLAHLRFKHVEITPNPQGLYRDYDVLINLITKDNYEGIEGLINTSGSYKPSQEDPMSTIAPNFTFSYTRNKKLNLAIHYDYLYSLQQTESMNIERFYPDYTLKTFKNSGPVETSKSTVHNTWVDADYDFNQNHSISFRYTYANRNPRVKNDFMVEKTFTDENKENTLRRELTTVQDPNKEHIATLYYRGRAKEWKLYGDFNYNYYTSDNDYRFEEEDGQQLYTALHNQKHYTRLALDATRTIKEKTTVNVGYINVFRQYKSQNDITSSSSYEYRNQIYASVSRIFNSQLNGNLHGNAELLRSEYSDNHENQWLWSLGGNLRYRFNKSNYFINCGYNIRTTYPNQGQLNPIGYQSGYDVWIVGNPNLKANLLHMVKFDVYLGKFSILGGMNYSGNYISNLVTQDETTGIVQSYYNLKYFNPYGGVRFLHNKILFDNRIAFTLNCELNCNFIHYRLKGKNVNSHNTTVSGKANLGMIWIRSKYSPIFSIQYNDDGYGYRVLPQGHSKNHLKSLSFIGIANFFNGKLQTSIQYYQPLKIGDSNWRYSEQETPYYSVKIRSDQYELRHRLEMKLIWRFATGHQIRKKGNKHITEFENNSLL